MASHYCANCNHPTARNNGCAQCDRRMMTQSQPVVEGMGVSGGSLYGMFHCLVGLYALYLFFTGYRWTNNTVVDLSIACCCPYVYVGLYLIGKTKKYE